VRGSLTSKTNQTQIKTEFLSADDPYKFSRTEVEFPLLTDLQRSSLIDIDSKLEEFENIIKKSASNYKECFCNGIIVNGQPGTGKTYNIMRWLEDLQEAGKIYGYETYSGKISPVTLYKVLKETTEKRNILVLDDCDVFYNSESLNLLKAALNNTKDKNDYKSRLVSYGTRGRVDSFSFDSFLIMITNESFDRQDYNELSDHMKAVLDRVHLMSVTLTREDILIKNLSIVENFINKDKRLNTNAKQQLLKVFNEEIHDMLIYDIFEKCKVNFSIRFFLKLADLIMLFGDSWKSFSNDYKKLSAELARVKSSVETTK
jgi:hypothetical protein